MIILWLRCLPRSQEKITLWKNYPITFHPTCSGGASTFQCHGKDPHHPFHTDLSYQQYKTLAPLTVAHIKKLVLWSLLGDAMWSLMSTRHLRTGTMDGQVSLDPVGVVWVLQKTAEACVLRLTHSRMTIDIRYSINVVALSQRVKNGYLFCPFSKRHTFEV